MTKDTFLTVENLKLCQKVFESYMQDKYEFSISLDGAKTNSKKLLYDIMTDVNKKYSDQPDVSLKDMNNVTLNIARDFYKTNYKLNKPQQKPHVRNLERDQNVYGPRILNFEQIKPQPTFKRSIESVFEEEEQKRNMESKQQPATLPEMSPILESAFNPDEFNRKLSELEKRRTDIDVKDLTSMNSTRMEQDMTIATQTSENPKKLYQMTQTTNNRAQAQVQTTDKHTHNQGRTEFITPSANQMILVDKYLSVNGFDRNWTTEDNRFNFRVDFSFGENSLQHKYKNIRSIEATRVIIPMEIGECKSIINVPKTYFNHEFSFSYPYLMLYVEEFNDVYDGTNDNIRRCFCQLVFDKAYKAPNGRGYIILNPIQKEKKVFHQSPLSLLSRMSLSLRKPNGQLFNTSKDQYKVYKVEYEVRNKQYLKIVTNIYFDKNEFYKGDTIMIKDFMMTIETPEMSSTVVNFWNEYINRKEGHEVLEIGQANDRGYFRTFYIGAPGSFDVNIGEYQVDTEMIANLNKYNDTIDFSSWQETNGAILNCSLQCSVTFTMQTITTDPSIIDMSYKIPLQV